MANEQPVTRKERFLAGAAGEDITLDTPITREERFLAKAAGMDVKTDDPVTRSEKYLAKIAEGGGGGGGSVPEYTGSYTVTPSEQTQTLSTKDTKCTDDITVNPIPSSYIVPTGTKQITQNGTGIDVSAYADVDVNVPSVTPTGTIQISQNGQVDVTDYASANVNVSGGVVEAPMKDVNFYDYDGTRLYSYTAQEFLALTEMPANPTHSGLTAQGWNWTLADAKDQVVDMGALDLGQLYITDDGKTRIYISIENKLSCCLGLNLNGTAVIDWGDNSAQSTITGTNINNTVGTTHTFSSGKYVISIDITGSAKIKSDSSTKLLCKNYSGSGWYDVYYARAIYRVELGSNITIDNYAFSNCISLQSITIPNNPNIFSGITYCFNECVNLIHITVPSSSATPYIGSSSYSVPIKSMSIGGGVFSGALRCPQLKKIAIPRGSISANTLSYCPNLTDVSFGSYVGSFYGGFEESRGIQTMRFASLTPPTVSQSTIIKSSHFNMDIYVPFNALASYVVPPTNYPSTTNNRYIGFATYTNEDTLPTQDTTAAYNVVWYASKADAIAQTNPITVGNGNEIYCRYTAV